jgi:hypothetical protein
VTPDPSDDAHPSEVPPPEAANPSEGTNPAVRTNQAEGPDPAVTTAEIDRVFRAEHGRAISVLVRVFGDIDIAEESV